MRRLRYTSFGQHIERNGLWLLADPYKWNQVLFANLLGHVFSYFVLVHQHGIQRRPRSVKLDHLTVKLLGECLGICQIEFAAVYFGVATTEGPFSVQPSDDRPLGRSKHIKHGILPKA